MIEALVNGQMMFTVFSNEAFGANQYRRVVGYFGPIRLRFGNAEHDIHVVLFCLVDEYLGRAPLGNQLARTMHIFLIFR